jgi:sigma-E factor negative regulatory protein RseB
MTVCVAADGAEAGASAQARAWLTRIHAAANTGNYRGTMVFSVDGSMSSSRVWHYCVAEQTFEKLESLDGRQQQIYRHNDDVHTLWPQTRVAVLEKRETPAAWSTTPQTVDPRVLEQYELKREGRARVAGREADVFVLEPRDDARFAQRLWADQSSGLLLRADVLSLAPATSSAAGRTVVESTAFSEVEIGIKPQPDVVQAGMRKLEGYRVLRPTQRRTQLEAEGWALARPVAGFVMAGCVTRPLDTAGERSSAAEPVLHAVFSDGLAHVSLFVEPYNAGQHRHELQARQGATGTVMQRRKDHWFTAVGDVPIATLKRFVDALERRK